MEGFHQCHGFKKCVSKDITNKFHIIWVSLMNLLSKFTCQAPGHLLSSLWSWPGVPGGPLLTVTMPPPSQSQSHPGAHQLCCHLHRSRVKLSPDIGARGRLIGHSSSLLVSHWSLITLGISPLGRHVWRVCPVSLNLSVTNNSWHKMSAWQVRDLGAASTI